MAYYDPSYGYTYPQFPNMVAPQYQQQVNPYQQMQNSCNCENRFVWVQGREGAKAYPTAPNRTVLFLDDQEPFVYQKKTDSEGKTSEFKVYRLVEEPQEESTPEIPASNYVTKDDFNQALSELKSMISNIKPYQAPYNKGKKVNVNG